MTFVQRTWKNRISEFFNRYRLENTKTGEVSTAYINLNDGAVEEEGDKINADALNDLEERIAEAFEGTGKGSNFVGTLAQWNALTDAEKEEYDTYDLTDDFEGYGVEMNVTSGSTKVITSGGVANHLVVGNRKFYFDYQNGKYGYNTSANRGADTFFPFKQDTFTLVGGSSNVSTATFSNIIIGDKYIYVATYNNGTTYVSGITGATYQLLGQVTGTIYSTNPIAKVYELVATSSTIQTTIPTSGGHMLFHL